MKTFRWLILLLVLPLLWDAAASYASARRLKGENPPITIHIRSGASSRPSVSALKPGETLYLNP